MICSFRAHQSSPALHRFIKLALARLKWPCVKVVKPCFVIIRRFRGSRCAFKVASVSERDRCWVGAIAAHLLRPPSQFDRFGVTTSLSDRARNERLQLLTWSACVDALLFKFISNRAFLKHRESRELIFLAVKLMFSIEARATDDDRAREAFRQSRGTNH